MNQSKKGVLDPQFRCEICEIASMSHAQFALHEFTKKHCDNLIRGSKNKPILKKQKTKNKVLEVEKETEKINTVTNSGSFSKYGYFIPGEVYTTPKEFNSDYDLYLQKFAESSKETKPLLKEEVQQSHNTVLTSVAMAPQKKKKKKSNVKICHICNLKLLTTPSYTAHMKSLEHILKLKVSGMGVSAHFVKSSSDLHTIKANKDHKVCRDLISVNGKSNQQNSLFGVSSSNCNNSDFAELTRKYDTDEFIKTADGKKIKLSKKEELFCYTCNIALNTFFQYNEHKNGRKHKSKCRALIEKGMTIPPEERIPEFPDNDTGQPIYPPKYALMIELRQKSACSIIQNDNISSSTSFILELPAKTNFCDQDKVLTNFKKISEGMTPTGIEDEIDCETKVSKPLSNNELVKKSNSVFDKTRFVIAGPNEKPNIENSFIFDKNCYTNKTAEVGDIDDEDIDGESENKIVMLSSEEYLQCSICNENFQWPFQFDKHLTKEEHLQKIVELKVSGKHVEEILDLIFADRNVIKPTNIGKLLCSICSITVDNELEFKLHLSSLVHKYMKKDFRDKITLEVKELMPFDKNGMYYCKLCRIKLSSLVEFRQHIFSAEHISIKKKNGSAAQAQYQKFIKNFKRKAGENPEEKAYDVNIGADEKLDSLRDGNKLSTTNEQKWFDAGYQLIQRLTQASSGSSPPSLLSSNFLPPKKYFSNRFPIKICSPKVKTTPPSLYYSSPL